MIQRFVFLLVAGPALLLGQGPPQLDLYPEVRALLMEAELAANGLREVESGLNPWTWAGQLYAKAGYLQDAERVYGPSENPPYPLWKARVVYGDLEGAEASLEKISSPEWKAGCFAALADLLWRMEKPGLAQARFEKAMRLASRIPNLEGRARFLDRVRVGMTYVNDPPPIVVSPEPAPMPKHKSSEPRPPDFPMTTGGFRAQTPVVRTAQMKSDETYLKSLYDRVAARDRDGAFGMVKSAKTMREKSLGYAAIGHLLIQAAEAQGAEETIRQMPEADSDSRLAKAEALATTGAAWLMKGNSEAADRCFQGSLGLVNQVKELPFAKLTVTLRVVQAQSGGGMVSSAAQSLQRALELAETLPERPKRVPGQRVIIPPGVHYRDEGYEKVLLAAILVRDLGTATVIEGKWRGGGSSVAAAWLEAEMKERALAAARRIVEQRERVRALLWLADRLLNELGAPNF